MKLTEAKLKQMILEALKSSKFQDFGTSTPDSRLRTQVGGSNFDKIQNLDPEQRDVMRQTFDPDYPREIKQEKINDILEPLGFTEFKPGYFNKDDMVYKVFDLKPYAQTRYNVVFSFGVDTTRVADFEDYKRHPKSIRYKIEIQKFNPTKSGQDTDKEVLLRKAEYIKTPKMFAVDMSDEQEREQMESLIIKKEKDDIIKALEGI